MKFKFKKTVKQPKRKRRRQNGDGEQREANGGKMCKNIMERTKQRGQNGENKMSKTKRMRSLVSCQRQNGYGNLTQPEQNGMDKTNKVSCNYGAIRIGGTVC